ncbi:hypothetical protein, partial [uncultured Eubacterium sp.]|uniref:hypothetical protein n=1 Tax=uncultured Eubacterium sp. TaxID=165185 RepID=UPI002804B195
TARVWGDKKQIEHRVQSAFGVFRLLLSRSTIVQLPLQNAKFSSISQQPSGVSNLLLVFFDTPNNPSKAFALDGFCHIYAHIIINIIYMVEFGITVCYN